MDRKLSFAAAVGLTLILSSALKAADFAMGFEGCPATLSGAPGEVKTFEVFCTLTTSNNTGADGAQGWSLSVAIDGGIISAVALKGVKVSTVYDQKDPDNPDLPPVHRDPYEQELNAPEVFTKIFAKATLPADPTKLGAISAVVLRSDEKMVLQPNGTQRIFKLTVQGTIPLGDTAVPLTLRYVDGYKSSVSQPVPNVATFGGSSVKPSLGSCTVLLSPPHADFILSVVETGTVTAPSGDTVIARDATPGDVLVSTDVLLTTAGLPAGDGPQGWSLSIRNENCMEISTVALKGVKVSTIYDQKDPDNPDLPPTHRDPYLQELNAPEVFTKIFAKATGLDPSPLPDDAVGAISAVVLRSDEKMVLHANATDTVFRIVYKIKVVDGATTNCKVTIEDGLKSTVSQPVPNVITYGGTSKQPTIKNGLTIRLTGKVVVEDLPAAFIRGDANNDGKVNIADVVWIVYDVVPSLNGPPTLCLDAGDANDDGKMDLVDAVYLIDWQFRGSGKPPLAPYPACGKDAGSTLATCPKASTACP